MAKATVKMPENLLEKLQKLGNQTDRIIESTLEAGGEVALAAVKGNLDGVIGRNTKEPSRSSGELAGALGLSPVKVDRNGTYNVKVGFREPRRDGGVNAKIANILEYGKHGQPAKPFLKPAKHSSRDRVIDAMKKKLDEEIAAL